MSQWQVARARPRNTPTPSETNTTTSTSTHHVIATNIHQGNPNPNSSGPPSASTVSSTSTSALRQGAARGVGTVVRREVINPPRYSSYNLDFFDGDSEYESIRGGPSVYTQALPPETNDAGGEGGPVGHRYSKV